MSMVSPEFPEKTLLYVPDWRTHPYDVMYPDYTPGADALELTRVARTSRTQIALQRSPAALRWRKSE